MSENGSATSRARWLEREREPIANFALVGFCFASWIALDCLHTGRAPPWRDLAATPMLFVLVQAAALVHLGRRLVPAKTWPTISTAIALGCAFGWGYGAALERWCGWHSPRWIWMGSGAATLLAFALWRTRTARPGSAPPGP